MPQDKSNLSSLEITNVSIAVLSEGSNPRLLNPDFLARNGIVEEWEVKDVIVTPPFARVLYENGVSIIVEETKIQFQANNPDQVSWRSELSRMANAYLSVLPHVDYTSAGLNFTVAWVMPSEVNKQLVSKMLREGPWLKFDGGITGASLELHYRSSQPYLNLKVGTGLLQKGDKRENAFLFVGNFHHDFSSPQRDERKEFISSLNKRQSELFNLIELFALE